MNSPFDLFEYLKQFELKDSIDNQHTLLSKLSCLHYDDIKSMNEESIIKTKLSYLYKLPGSSVAK